MNSNNKRELLQRDLYQALKTMSPNKLKTKIASSNISKLKKISSAQMMSSELAKLYFECQQTKSLNTFFHSLNLIVQHEIKNITENVFIKYADPQKYSLAQNEICYCKQPIINGYGASICLSCNQLCHKTCIYNPELNSISQCPLCFIKTMDPFCQVKQVVFYHTITLRQKSLSFEVNLSKVRDNEQVQLRCVKIDPNPFYNSQISWPDNCVLQVNNIDYLKLKPLEINTAAKRREDKSIDLPPTQYRRKTKIQIKIKPYYNGTKQFRLKNCNHLFAVVIIKNNKISDLITSMLKHISNEIIYRCALLERFNKNNKWISTEKQKITVNCPFSKDRMQIPVRGGNCVHLQCFDLKNFLAFNKITKLYKCPIFCCSERCHNLVIDPVIMKVLKDSATVEFIEFSEQGQNILNKHIQEITIESDEEQDFDKLSTSKISMKSILIDEGSQYQFRRLKLKKPKANNQQSKRQVQVKQQQIIIESKEITLPFIIVKEKQTLINNSNLEKSTPNVEDYGDCCLLTSVENIIQSTVQQQFNISTQKLLSTNIVSTMQKSKQKSIETLSKVSKKKLTLASQNLIQIKDSDDEDFQERFLRRIKEQKYILDQQRERVEKKSIDLSIYDMCILNKHFLRLVLDQQAKQSSFLI